MNQYIKTQRKKKSGFKYVRYFYVCREAGNQIQRIAKSVYKAEAQAAGTFMNFMFIF